MAEGRDVFMVDPSIFEDLQTKVEEDTKIRDELRECVKTLERQGRSALSVLSRVHSTPTSHYHEVVAASEKAIQEETETVVKLSEVASRYPYYKYNQTWTREIQNFAFAIIFCGWLGGFGGEQGRLLTIEQVGEVMKVPVNLKDRDAFHLTIEEYLLSLISLTEELSRLAVNAVTLGDYRLPIGISKFVKDVHAGFQILNLKNDVLRRRNDSIKYNIKKIEDVVYDLSLRNLVPPDAIRG